MLKYNECYFGMDVLVPKNLEKDANIYCLSIFGPTVQGGGRANLSNWQAKVMLFSI